MPTDPPVLHPEQFEVNEAWIAFRLNGSPVRTEFDGDFHCIALMDAASCFILCTQFIGVAKLEPTTAQFRKLLKEAAAHKKQLPKTLLIARGDTADMMTREAMRQGIEVVRVPDGELHLFIGEAREGFAERFE